MPKKWRWKSLCKVQLFVTPWSIVHGILRTRILEWVAFPFSRGSSQPRDWTQVSTLQADSSPAEPSGLCLILKVSMRYIKYKLYNTSLKQEWQIKTYETDKDTSIQSFTYVVWYILSISSRTVAQTVKNLPAMQKSRVQSLGWEDPLEKEMAIHSIILAWEILWTVERSGL